MHLFLFFVCFCYRPICCCYNQPARLLMHLTWAGSDRLLPHAHSLCVCMLCRSSCVPTLCDPMGGSLQASPSMGFSRQEYRSGLSCSPPEGGPHPGPNPPLTPVSLVLQVDSLLLSHQGSPAHSLCSTQNIDCVFDLGENKHLLKCSAALFSVIRTDMNTFSSKSRLVSLQ